MLGLHLVFVTLHRQLTVELVPLNIIFSAVTMQLGAIVGVAIRACMVEGPPTLGLLYTQLGSGRAPPRFMCIKPSIRPNFINIFQAKIEK